jgi:hypothetical protein
MDEKQPIKPISGILENLLAADEDAIERERRETFRRTSAEWAGMPEDDGDETKPDQVRCRICYEPMRRIDAFYTSNGDVYCGACRKQQDDIASGQESLL